MATININNYKEALHAGKISGIPLYEFNDLIEFEFDNIKGQHRILQYYAQSNHLRGCNTFNDSIFDELGLNKQEFCKKIYGHTPREGLFPECRTDSFNCIYNIVEALFDECVKNNKSVNKINIEDINNTFLETLEFLESNKLRLPEVVKVSFQDNIIDELESIPFI